MVLFHAGCPDGFCAAWIVHTKWPDAEFIAVSYGYPPPPVAARDVLILDFSYKRQVLQEMALKAASLRVLDHHESAQRDLEGFLGAKIVLGKSGARLAYEEFYGTEKMRWDWIVDYTEDRDLGLDKLPATREISVAIASFPRTFEAWTEMIERGYGPLIAEGGAILRYKDQLVRQVVANATELILDGHSVLVTNCGVGNLESEVAAALAINHPFGACWSESGNKRKWSLRSTASGSNVARIAERYGGGGHEHAAGFIESIREPKNFGGINT